MQSEFVALHSISISRFLFLGHIAHNIFFPIQATPGHYAIGLKILSQLISEMNQVRV